MRKWKELLVPSLSFLYIILYLYQSWGESKVVIFFPYFVSSLLTIMILFIIYKEIISKKSNPTRNKIPSLMGNLYNYKKEFIAIFFALIYYFIFNYIGFNVANVFYLTFMFSFLGLKKKLTISYSIIISLIFFAIANIMKVEVPNIIQKF